MHGRDLRLVSPVGPRLSQALSGALPAPPLLRLSCVQLLFCLVGVVNDGREAIGAHHTQSTAWTPSGRCHGRAPDLGALVGTMRTSAFIPVISK